MYAQSLMYALSHTFHNHFCLHIYACTITCVCHTRITIAYVWTSHTYHDSLCTNLHMIMHCHICMDFVSACKSQHELLQIYGSIQIGTSTKFVPVSRSITTHKLYGRNRVGFQRAELNHELKCTLWLCTIIAAKILTGAAVAIVQDRSKWFQRRGLPREESTYHCAEFEFDIRRSLSPLLRERTISCIHTDTFQRSRTLLWCKCISPAVRVVVSTDFPMSTQRKSRTDLSEHHYMWSAQPSAKKSHLDEIFSVWYGGLTLVRNWLSGRYRKNMRSQMY